MFWGLFFGFFGFLENDVSSEGFLSDFLVIFELQDFFPLKISPSFYITLWCTLTKDL